MSKEVRNCYITNWENLSKLETPSLISTHHSDHSSNLNNSNLLSSITANKFYVDNNLNVIELSPYNISNYSISNYESQINFNKSIYNTKFGNTTNKIFNLNIKKQLAKNLSNKGKFNKISSRELFKINNNPGPGFYIDRFKHSSFKIKNIPESNQFFGSRIERFYRNNKSYDNEDSFSINDNKIKSKSFISLAPFSMNTKRFKIPYYLQELFQNPSPTDYNNNKLKKVKSFSNFDNFNTSAKRFIIDNNSKWKKEIPGPGHYNPEKIKKHISSRKLRFSYEKISNRINNKTDIYINPINYKINTIEYINNKKLNSTNLKNVTFFKCNPKITKSSSCTNFVPDPGTYYIDKKYEYKQINPAFSSSTEKKNGMNTKSEINVGSGQYNHDSYFDWHKKSFNISYI